MDPDPPETLDYARPAGDPRRKVGRFVVQFIAGFVLAVGVVLLLIPATGPGPMIPAVVLALEKVVGPAAVVLVAFAIYAHRRLRWRGFSAGVATGLLIAGLVAGACAAAA
jgi:hypothetical protein